MTYREAKLQRQLDEMDELIADLERNLAQWEPFMQARQVREAEEEIEELTHQYLELEMELERLSERSLFECIMEGDEWEYSFAA